MTSILNWQPDLLRATKSQRKVLHRWSYPKWLVKILTRDEAQILIEINVAAWLRMLNETVVTDEGED